MIQTCGMKSEHEEPRRDTGHRPFKERRREGFSEARMESRRKIRERTFQVKGTAAANVLRQCQLRAGAGKPQIVYLCLICVLSHTRGVQRSSQRPMAFKAQNIYYLALHR